MNKKKAAEKKRKRGLMSHDEHMALRKARQLLVYQKNPKNKNNKPFTS